MDLPLSSVLYQNHGTLQSNSFLSVSTIKDYWKACNPLNIASIMKGIFLTFPTAHDGELSPLEFYF